MALRILSLNLRAFFGPGGSQAEDLAKLIASHQPDVVLLQEARPRWREVVCRAAGLTGTHSLEVAPRSERRRADGCVIAVRPPLRIERVWRLPPSAFAPALVTAALSDPIPAGYEILPDALADRFSTRTLFAEVSSATHEFVVASFHATPGTGLVGGKLVSEWKPLFHGAAAIALTELALPFVFAIDANEPEAETIATVRFHWHDGRPGAAKFAALLGLPPLHRARDLQREQIIKAGSPPAAPDYLALTYTTTGGTTTRGAGRRFDSIWATAEFTLDNFETFYADALAAGSDHALLRASTTLE